jgi:hypothetical protein
MGLKIHKEITATARGQDFGFEEITRYGGIDQSKATANTR